MQLKYHFLYRKRLQQFAKSIGLSVKFKHQDTEGLFVPSRHYISIDKELEQSDEIATLLHELGHALDDSIKKLEYNKRLEKSYKAIYTKKYSKSQLLMVLDCEKRAWKYGRALANRLNIKLGKWYNKFQNQCLRSYRIQNANS